MSVADIEKKIDQLLPAIKGLGGSASVSAVFGNVVQVKFSGPERLKKGIEMAIKDDKRVTGINFV